MPQEPGAGQGVMPQEPGAGQGAMPQEPGAHTAAAEHLRAVPQVAPGARIAAQTSKTSSEMAAEVRGSLALLRVLLCSVWNGWDPSLGGFGKGVRVVLRDVG